MKINRPLNDLPEVIDDIRYCVLDCTDPDLWIYSLIFLESFSVSHSNEHWW